MSNLRLIKEIKSTSSVSTIDVTDVFSSEFDIYQIQVSDIECSVSGSWWSLRFINSAGSVEYSAKYDYAMEEMRSFATTAENSYLNTTSIPYVSFNELTTGGLANIVVFNPYTSSSNTHLTLETVGYYAAGGMDGVKGIGAYKQNSSLSGFRIQRGTGLFENMTIRVYGIGVN